MVWITVNFPEDDKWLYDAIKTAAHERRQPVSQYMRALAEAELTPEEASGG